MALTPMSVVALAETLARRYHAGQVDRLGVPYIEHPRAVAGLLAGAPEPWRAAAWLHDVLEHTDATPAELAAAGVPPEVVRVVEVLTRRPGEDYLAFIGRVCADPVAVRVKIADALHNLDPTRDFGPTAGQRARYHRALVLLFGALPADG
ncbi:MAG TPA: HD domain-containing protein [Acidimicrobiia bacterium]|nr:HD domain-containing protein [Acidimicrobiia bacterium]